MHRHLMVIAATAAALFAVSTEPAPATQSPICTRGLTTVERDPRGLLPLTDMNPVGPATAAALQFGEKASRPQVRSALFATADHQRGNQARYSCGIRVWQRTIVVYVRERASLPAQSASNRVYFVGRFRSGYHVWQVVK